MVMNEGGKIGFIEANRTPTVFENLCVTDLGQGHE